MDIREATAQDIPEIVALLKQSLGESLMPKSEHYWRWKHLENPFGPSPVLLCRENDTLIGVRAFMRWRWKQGGQLFHAVRAVDTATHPGHQGKGIFKKLTLNLVDLCKKNGDHFVFNTPNSQSKPGYLKMGWEEAGKLPIAFSVQHPFRMAWNLATRKVPQAPLKSDGILSRYLSHPGLHQLLERNLQDEAIVTDISPAYLAWRYQHVPVVDYVAVGEENGNALTGLILGRIKPTKLGNELRITDCFLDQASQGNQLIENLMDARKKWNVDYTTLSGTPTKAARKLFSTRMMKMPVGPVVTIRSLQMDDKSKLQKFYSWSPSLGDLELF
ncbi:MAG TPA: GNAT family N-acetyltransferase [Chryseolinea sp.]